MTDPTASPEDHWKQTDGAFSDSGFDHSEYSIGFYILSSVILFETQNYAGFWLLRSLCHCISVSLIIPLSRAAGFFAETARKGSVVSRANSIGSTSASSVPNTDDEDSDYRHEASYKDSYKDRRRQAHTQAEQKRRDAIKKGYDDLQTIVPTCQQQSEFAVGAQKISKATVLQKTIDYIHFLHKEKKKQEEEVSVLRKEVMALKIMKANYEQIVNAHQNNPQQGEDQVSDQVKFSIFQSIMDSLFQSFSSSVSMNSFQELSACVFSWIEEHCKPQTLREFVVGVLRQLSGQLY
ncbi:max X [Solea senegalensis]|uniref:Max-like protein X n=1 Tax=Solea senegalensis TaxID=28829 RepID=A0AAV6RL94_SOLSE|nr:max X [Solea senegalensis]